MPFEHPARRMIEENFWRAIRYGLDGKLIDLERGGGVPGGGRGRPAAGMDRAGARGARHRARRCPSRTGPSARRVHWRKGESIEDVFAAEVAETQRTYAAEEVRTTSSNQAKRNCAPH